MKRSTIVLATALLALGPSTAWAGTCADIASAYQDTATQVPGILPPIFDGWDAGSGRSLDYETDGATANLSCTADADIWNFEFQVAYTDANSRAHATVEFSYALQAVGGGLDPNVMLSQLMTQAAQNIQVEGDKASGDARMQVGSNYTATVDVEQHADDSGAFTLWIAPIQQ